MLVPQKSEVQITGQSQGSIWADSACIDNPEYLSRQLITYIGNKRSLISQINNAVEIVKARIGKNRLRTFDVFSGSGVVSRLLKAHSSRIVSNDLENYAEIIGRCYLANRSEVDVSSLRKIIDDINERVSTERFPPGFIEYLYSPGDEKHITKTDRVFYTKNNAQRLDNFRRLIDEAPADMRDFLLGPLLSEASIHANTSGVFKGFHKNRHTKIGQYGGSNRDALLRIFGDIVLKFPIFSDFECEYEILQQDANVAVRQVSNLDLAYIDPPYNQHPYGSNYFMLNLIAQYEKPTDLSKISGIPKNWRRSGYNVRGESLRLMTDLVHNIDAQFLLISFNNEGFISPSAMKEMLDNVGSVEVININYNAFRGSRSFKNRPIHVTEHLFIVEKR